MVILIVIVALAGILSYIIRGRQPSLEYATAEEYFGITGEDEVALVTSSVIVPVPGTRMDDGRVYIPYDETIEYVTNKIYYDRSADTLTVTTPTEIHNITGEGSSKAFVHDGEEVLVSLDFLTEYTHLDATYYEGPSRVVIHNEDGFYSIQTEEDTVLRTEPDIKSKIICDLPAGTSLSILDSGDAYDYVSTADGFIGYADKKTLAAEMTPPAEEEGESLYPSISYDFPINLAFHQIYEKTANTYLIETLNGTSGINVIGPTWFFLDDVDGEVRNLTSTYYVEEAHNRGLKVWAVANDFDGGINSTEETYEVLRQTEKRQSVEKIIVEGTKEVGADGVCIDFEQVGEECASAFITFVREMSALCRSEGLALSVCSYVPQPYNLYLDREGQAEVVDYVITMAYDEHHKGSESAGSVSSISWVKEAVDGTLAEVPKEKTIIALPFYTRLWASRSGSAPESTAMGMAEAEEYIQTHGMKVTWDDVTKQNYAELTGDVHYEIWVEDEQSIMQKMRVVSSAGVAGVAEWKLGLEKKEIWNVIESYL